MNTINRRSFLQRSLLSTAALSLPGTMAAQPASRSAPPRARDSVGPELIDTHVHLFSWPFRHLKYAETGALVEKLRKHRVQQAWAGSYEGLLHKDIDGANARLVDECRTHGGGVLLPFGSVNPIWPDWEEDLRRCHELYRMPGIRLHPSYQNYGLNHPGFRRLLRIAAERGLVVQIVAALEDERVQHSNVISPDLELDPLFGVLKETPGAKVQLLHAFRQARGPRLRRLVAETNVTFEISNLEGNGGVGRLLEGRPFSGEEERQPGRGVPVPLERVLFGSHAPYMPLENALLKMFESPLTAAQFNAIARDNASRLLAGPTLRTAS